MLNKELEQKPSLKKLLGDLACISVALCGAGVLLAASKITDLKKKRKSCQNNPLVSKEDSA
jgi:hypothetical protein